MSSFADFCTDYFNKYFELHPTEAIYYGIEGYDHLLNDYSDETYRAEKAFVEESLNTLRQIPINDLDKDQAIDHADPIRDRFAFAAHEPTRLDPTHDRFSEHSPAQFG